MQRLPRRDPEEERRTMAATDSKPIDGEKTIVLTGITNTQNNENIQKIAFL